MYKIRKKEVLASNIKLFEIAAPDIAKKARAGQFIILRLDEKAERIPLTIADYDRKKGTITIIFQEVGRSTYDLGKLEKDEQLLDFVGPLGKESDIDYYGTVVCIGGGVGVAPVYPITRDLHDRGNRVLSIIGARSRENIIWEEQMKKVSDSLYVVTDDGSYGEKGFVTDVLEKIISNENIDMVVAIGPLVMMESVSNMTRTRGIKTVVSLNSIMLDGTGMCGACRVGVGEEIKFACVDGPEFDGHMVDWEVAKSRANMFKKEEKIALEAADCNCLKKGGGC